MFESQVAYYLNKYLGTYLEGIDSASLRISVFRGDVELTNLQLKPDALDDLDLPVVVKGGLLGSLTLKVPWSGLGRVPVEVKMDRLYVLAGPRPDTQRGKGVVSPAEVEAAFQQAKKQRVEKQEAKWVEELEHLQQQRDRQKEGADGNGAKESGGGGPGMLKAVIDTVIGNLQLSITNVHVRYEDDISNPGQPFACGVTLERLGAYTVDEMGKEAFVTNNPLDILRKAAQLRRLSIYFDTSTQFWDPGQAWRALAPQQWDTWFLPGVAAAGQRQQQQQQLEGTAKGREFVLQPVDGRALYTRRGSAAQRGNGEPVLEMSFELDVVALRLSQPQYQSYQLLLSEVSSFTSRLPYNAFRPRMRPAAGESCRSWWRYAFLAVRAQLLSRKLTWGQAVEFARARKAYVPLYAQLLRAQLNAAFSRHDLANRVAAMDKGLPENTILMFRRLAHAEVQREKRREARAAAKAGTAAKKQDAGKGTWFGWLTGAGGGEQAGGAAAGTAASAAEGGVLRGDLAPEEYARLLELVSEQEEGLKLGTETPYTLLTRVSAKVGSASAILVAADCTRILRGGLEGVSSTFSKYPQTTQVDLAVTAMGVESPEGVFIRTGAELHRAASAADLSEEMYGAGQEGSGDRALQVTYTQSPQDGSADAVVDVVLTPSYVHYSAATAERVVNFFKAPQALDFSAIGAAASGKLDKARRLAADYAAAALRSRPKLRMSLCLDAPKVAVPVGEGKGQVTLVLDLGRFVIRSDPVTAGRLPGEEAALYECIRLDGKDVSAYVVDGPFDWHAREQGDREIPLLERCGLDIALQAARFQDPRFPMIRLQPSVPVLHFYLSPGRLGRLMRVLRAALPEGESQPGGATGAVSNPKEEPWREHAEQEGALRVLTWTGIGKSTLVWCPRFGVVYQGRLYIYDSESSSKPVATHSFWSDQRVAKVPADAIGGVDHVLALLPPSADISHAAEEKGAVLLRLDSEEEADSWYRRLLAAQQSMRDLSGEIGPALPDWDEGSSTISASDTDEISNPALLAPPQQAQLAQQQGPLTLLQVDAQLGELAVFVSGREPQVWWPPMEPVPSEIVKAAECCTEPVVRAEDIVNVDGEGALICLRAAGGACRFTYGDLGMVVCTALGSLEVEDLLVGPRCPQARFLARSNLPADGVVQTEGDLFFDPDEALLSADARSRSGSLQASPVSSPVEASHQPPEDSAAQQAQRELAEFDFRIVRPTSPDYKGVDTSLDVSLRTLYFYCNRPTVAALMSLGTDISDAIAAAQQDGGAGGGSEEGSGGKGSDDEGGSGDEGDACKAEGMAAIPGAQSGDGAGNAAKVLGGGDDRVVFQLAVSLSRLQVVLNYEGAKAQSLSQASMDEFDFKLETFPERMAIAASLGNIQGVDCTLPANHPYHQALGLRSGSDTSLVSLNFGSHPATEANPRVPEGQPYYTLGAKLSRMQVVFLYRFLQENLSYITTMLAMRLPPVHPQAAGQLEQLQEQQQHAEEQQESQEGQGQGQEQQQQQPFLLLLDVEMDAPVISLPRNTHSKDLVESDLGVLKLTNRIVEQGQTSRGKPLLLDASELSFSGLDVVVVKGAKRGHNIIQNSEQGWQLSWRRPVVQGFEGLVPMFDMMLNIPFLKALLTDEEYQLMTSIAGDNFSEQPGLPQGAQWLTDHYQAQQDQQDGQQQQEGQQEQGPTAELVLSPPPGAQQPAAGLLVPTAKDDSPTKVRVVVSVGHVELELHRHVEGMQGTSPLARFTLGDLWVAFRNSQAGSMWVALCLPRVEAQDLRPDVPLEQSYAISSAHKASFLMMDWSASPGLVNQALAITLQKPLLVAELSFLLALTKWVVPGFSFGNNSPIAFGTHDILLSGSPHKASGDLWLSPTVRLLADAPGVTSFEYDGQGHSLTLPGKDHLDEQLPLILIGPGRTLRLRNVRLVNAATLPLCLQLAPGAQLLAEAQDSVSRIDGEADLAAGVGSPLSPRSLFARGLSAYATTSATSELSPQPSQAHSPSASAPQGPPGGSAGAAPQRSMQISVCAVGMALQFMQLQPQQGLQREGSMGAVGAGAERPGSAASGDERSRHSRAGSVESLASLRRASSAELAQQGALQRTKQAQPSSPVQILSAAMDVAATYKAQGTLQSGQVGIQGLRVETRFLADAAAKAQGRGEQQDFTQKKKLKGQMESTVLEPCSVALDFTLQPPGDGGAAGGRTDLNLDTSDLRLNLSPDVLELATSLAGSVAQPLMQPGPDQALIACTSFERIWTYDPSKDMPDQRQLAASLSVAGAEGGVTVWRPQCPPGYTVVGDVLTSGNSQPTFEVLAVAVNSGLVAYPQEYSLIWSGAGGSIWRPVPPEGYVALGDLVTCQGEPEPQLTAMACVHGSVVVEAPLGECLRLPPVLPTAPAAAAQAEAELTPVDLWCVDSSLATFLATTANSTEPGRGYDVRNPLGVTPAALAALPLPGSPDPRALFQHFCSSRKEQRTDEIHRVTTPTVVDFHRIWTDGGAITNGEGISIWRPAVAPGYASLGDCIMRGLDPPPSALVVRDGGGAEGEGLGQPGGMPLVAHPQGFQRVWMDLAQREEARLCLWLPVPKPGYVAMGCLATRGTASPPRGAAKCLRADAATQALASRSPLWVVRQEDRVMTPLSAWVADERLHTFVVAASDRASQPRECWRLRTSASEQAEASTHNATLQQQVGGVSVVARTGRASLVLRDSFRVPIVEVDLGALSAGVSGPSQQVVQAHLKLRLSVWSYNGAVRGWDPVVEPWDVLANMDTNLKGKVACGIEPGVHLSLKTSNEMIHTTLTFAALHSLLSAYADWQALRTHDPYRQLLSAVDKSSIKVEVENRLGVDATLELDWGDELRTVELPTSQPVPVIKPLPRFPTRQPEGLAGVTAATRAREAKPHDLLLVDVRELVAGGTGSGTVADKAQLYCSARLEGAAEQPAAGAVQGAPFRTRAVPWDAGKSSVAWKERLVLPIPIKPGTVLALVFEVWDVAAEGGSGALLGFGKVMLPAVSKLKEREKQEADVELDQGGFTLQAAYMLQHQWHEDGGAARPAGTSTVWAESTVGQRALCLATNPGVWAVVPTSGQQKGSGGGAVASLTPIKVGSEGVVLEATVDQGQRRETLRAPCQVFNNTQFPLEVSLVTVDDGDWQLVASRAGSVSGALSKDLVEEEVFENERWVSLKGWSSNNLRPEDPGKFRYQRRQYDDLPQVSLPPGWEWDGGWTLDRGGSVDKEGWAYAPDFSQLKFPPPPGAQKPSLADTVRSRRWLRYRRPAAGTSASRGPSLATASAQRSAAAPAAQQQGLAVRDRSWLGRVEPGGAQPLPLDWQRAGRQLQFRPVADPDLTTPVHDWSAGASEGPHTVKLECLDESLTRLAYCAPNLPAGAVVPGSEGASTLWFSITVDSDILAGGKQAEPLTDWRILVGPPLVLVNQLPISTSLLIWEKPQGSDKVVDRQTVQLASGGQVAVYGADMRAQVSFTLYTDAYEWVEAGPLVISQGQQGRPGRQSHLPDRFRLRRTGGSIPVEVFVQRHVDFGTWLLDAREELDPGAVAAKGVPLSVTLLSPLWVVNATSLAIDAAIVQVPPPPPAPKQDVSAIAAQQATGPSLGSKEHLRTLVTGDTQASARDDSFALRGRPIAPRSMEMLSYPLPSHLVAQQAQQGGSTGAGEPPSRRQYYGVRLRVAGSGWTPPLALDIVEVGGGGAQGAQTAETNLQNAQPLLIQARVPEFGAVYEVLARLEISQFKNSQVLRLEPHMVVSNRTSVPLQLLQCRPVLAAEGMATAAPGGGRPGAQRVGTLVPEGGASFSQATRGLNNMPLASGESTPLVRPSPSYIDRKWLGQPSPSFVGLSGDSTVGWERIPSVLPTGPTPLVRVAPPSQRALHDASALIDLPAGATAIPLHLSAGVPTHTLCFRSAPAAAATITAIGGAPLWSRPITLRYPQEQTLHLLVPISLEEAASAGAGGATSGSSPTGRADTPQEGGLQGGAEGRPSAYLSPAVFDATAGGSDGGSGAASEDAGRRGGGHVKRDSAHLTVLAAEPGAAPGRGGAPGGAVAVLRVRVSLRGFGGLHVVLETLQSDPPYLLENRTPLPLNYRQAHIKAAPFHTLPPWSAVGWVWEYTLHGAPNELEVQEALAQNPQLYALDPPESSASGKEQPASAAGKVRPLPVTGDIGQCTVKLGYWEQVVMTPVGLGTIGGESSAGGLGRGGIDRVMQLAPGAERLLLAGKSGGQGGPLELDMAFELPGVEVSIVDHTPQELLLLTLTGLKVSATRGPTPSGAQNSLRFQLAQFQIDDQLFGARFPVVLATAPSALAARQQLQRGASPADLPLLSLTLSKQAGGARGRTFYPYAGLRAPLALQLAVSETLVWRVAEFLQRVQARQQQHTSGTAAGADGPQHEPTALHDTAAADMPLHIGLLHVDDLRAELSFQGDPLSRPRYISGGMVATLLDLANFTAASITLRGLDEPDISMLRSAFVQRIAQKVQGQVFGIAFSLVRNFGIVGGASKLLGALSAGVAKLAAAEVTPEASAAKQAQRRTITDVGDGVVEGMGALGQSFMRGLQGLVKKPVQGMQQKGVGGAIVGVGQGLVGALANPVSGMLDALSATAEGFNASFGRKRDDALVWQRRRLPRAVGGEGRLQPIIGSDGTDRQARIDALGQALLKNTLLNAPDATLKRRHEPTEAYEQHFVLVEDRVVILTSRGIMLVVAPNFAVLDGAAEIGEELRVVDVPPGTREWCVPWGDLLTLELRWTSDDPNADRLIVHRKGKPGVQETESLAHQLKCFPKTGQAAQIKLVTQKVLGKYCLDPQRRDRAWTRRHQSHQELPQGAGPAQLPLTMPCLDFEPAWRTTAHRISSAVSFWTPVAPPGYRPAGDVVTLGTDPPGNPVPCLRDFTLCGGAGAPPVAAAGLTSPAESQQQHKPATCHPREYSLVWRQNSANPVTVWMPVPPLGYVALGAVVVGRAEVPGTDDYVCIREDLTSASQVFNSPLWSLDPLSLLGGGGGAAASTAAAMALQRKKPHHPETWKISVWQVDNRLGTFLAVRAFNKPPQNMIRTVDAVEEKEKAKLSAGGGV